MNFLSYKYWLLNEKFVEDSDPISDMGIGLPVVIKKWFEKLSCTDTQFETFIRINSDNTINVVGTSINLSRFLKGNFPDYIKFNTTGSFSIEGVNMTTLKGCPDIVEGNFNCSANLLTSLEFCPKVVNGNFICENNSKYFLEKTIRNLCKVSGDIRN